MSDHPQMPNPVDLAPATLQRIKSLDAITSQKGKVAIVSGGAAGLGYNIVNRLAEAGAKVVIADFNDDLAQKSIGEFQALGYDVSFVHTDVRVIEDVYACVDKTVEIYGGLDILVNNAAVWRFAPYLDTDLDTYNEVVDTDLKGPFFFGQAVARYMAKNGVRGKIINIASAASVSYDTTGGSAGLLSTYTVAKGGLVTLTASMGRELIQYGINVNCVSPGGMVTHGALVNGGSLRNYPEAAKRMSEYGRNTPMSTTPDDVALIVFWLTTDAANFMVGENVFVEGGLRYELVRESFAKSIQ
jgi:NAD(P)-dependent dehydrogenase (short-subunit alcohol dehydrogenase family)